MTRKKKLEFPCRLRELRKSQGKSVVGLAHDAGVKMDKIIYIERGVGEGQLSTHLKLAKALGVSLDEYLGFPSLRPVTGKKPEVILSDSNVTVEQLASVPGSAISVKRILLNPKKVSELTGYLDFKKFAFFYLAQGEAKIKIGGSEYLLKAGDHATALIPVKIRLENVSSLPLISLVIQA